MFKSRSQQKYFAAMVKRGDISEETYKEWLEATRGKDIPERVEKKTSLKQKVSKLKYVREIK